MSISPSTHDPVSCLQFTGSRLTFGTFSGRVYVYTVKPIPQLKGPTSTDYEILQTWATFPDTFQKQQTFSLGDRFATTPSPDTLVPNRDSGSVRPTSALKKPTRTINFPESPPHDTPPSLPTSPHPSSTMQSWALCIQMDPWRLIAGGGDGRCVVWNYLTGRKIYELKDNTIDTGVGPTVVVDDSTPIRSSSSSSNGSRKGKLELEEEKKDLQVPHGITGVAFDDRVIVTGGMDGVVRMFAPEGLI
ncbi:hypothetical protein HDV00_006254 [Rhizophlyctis rosea]|nr:hypothetical protein HDV00_006254 [Rhizophlyctis rosea]